MDDTNPMRSREARDNIRARAMEGLASGIAKGAIRHELVLGLLDLADEAERLTRERDEAVAARDADDWPCHCDVKTKGCGYCIGCGGRVDG